MSKLVTFEQAKKLKELGYNYSAPIYLETSDKAFLYVDDNEKSTISEALDWFREVKRIECEVCLRLCFMGDTGEAVFGGYEYIVFDHNTNKTISSTIYHNRNIAESALLDALIEYVSK